MAKGYQKARALERYRTRKAMWRDKMIELGSSAIYWDGLPETIDTVYLEKCLICSGSAIIVYDDVTNTWTNGQNASVGLLDRYGYPQQRSVIYLNGNKMWGTPENTVIIYNNVVRKSDLWKYELFAEDLADYDMAIKVNMNTQKTMPIIPAKLENALTLENVMADMIENVPYHLVDPNVIDLEMFKNTLVFDNKKSFTSDLMIKVQREYWNRILTMIGVNNVNVEKAERVNTYETNSNLDEIATFRRSKINARERACQQMKQLWGWNVKVGYYSDLLAQGGGMIGDLYRGTEENFTAGMAE